MTDDPYATAKANLRDNVKTLIAMFGGATAVLLAGTPFSGYAAIHDFSVAFFIASAALVIALGLLLWAVRVLLYTLRPDPTSLRLLTEILPGKEAEALRERFAEQKRDLLPTDAQGLQLNSVLQLVAEEEEAWSDYIDEINDSETADDRAHADFHKQRFDGIHANLEIIKHWIGFTRLHWRVNRGVDHVTIIGIGALVAIATFVMASSWAGKPDKPTPPSIYVVTPVSIDAPKSVSSTGYPSLDPVLFAIGQSGLTPDAVARITEARRNLRKYPETGLLIFANTDTSGSDRLNKILAYRRAESVADRLRTAGGIIPSRIFATPLAEKDLPALTGRRIRNDINRSVEMILVPLPARKP